MKEMRSEKGGPHGQRAKQFVWYFSQSGHMSCGAFLQLERQLLLQADVWSILEPVTPSSYTCLVCAQTRLALSLAKYACCHDEASPLILKKHQVLPPVCCRAGDTKVRWIGRFLHHHANRRQIWMLSAKKIRRDDVASAFVRTALFQREKYMMKLRSLKLSKIPISHYRQQCHNCILRKMPRRELHSSGMLRSE